jgi:hypothetical protein
MADQDTFLNGIEILDTSVATSTTASLYTLGGISILNTELAVGVNNGGSFLTLGGMCVSKNSILGGNTIILSSTLSTSVSSGSLILNGGLGINGGMYSRTVNIVDTVNASNKTTGALIVSGGVGINGDIYANNIYSNGVLLSGGGGGSVFGSDYNYAENLTVTATTAIVYDLIMSMTTGSLVGGTYKIAIGYDYDANSSTNSDALYLGLLDPTGTTGTVIHEYIDRLVRVNYILPIHTSLTTTLSAGVHRLALFVRNQTTSRVINTANKRLELFRVS